MVEKELAVKERFYSFLLTLGTYLLVGFNPKFSVLKALEEAGGFLPREEVERIVYNLKTGRKTLFDTLSELKKCLDVESSVLIDVVLSGGRLSAKELGKRLVNLAKERLKDLEVEKEKLDVLRSKRFTARLLCCIYGLISGLLVNLIRKISSFPAFALYAYPGGTSTLYMALLCVLLSSFTSFLISKAVEDKALVYLLLSGFSLMVSLRIFWGV